MLPHVGTLNSAYSAYSAFSAVSTRISCSVMFFRWKIAFGLALDKSWLLLTQLLKITDVYLCLFPWESFNWQTCKINRKKDAVWKWLGLSLHSSQTAMLPHIELSILSLLHLFIHCENSSSSFQSRCAGALLAQPQKKTLINTYSSPCAGKPEYISLVENKNAVRKRLCLSLHN